MSRLRLPAALFAAYIAATTMADDTAGTSSPQMAGQVTICYNYGCHATAAVDFTPAQLEIVQRMFAGVSDAEGERKVVGRVIGRMYYFAGGTTPIWRDHGLDYPDDGVDGKMDCIDHAHNTNEFLILLDRQGLLRFHDVHTRTRRMLLLFEHWTARISDKATGTEYAVDSWFFDPGEPAAVIPLADWFARKDPR